MRFLAKAIATFCYGVSLLLLAPICIWMLLNAATWIGFGLGICGLLALCLPLCITRWAQNKGRIWGRMATFSAFAILLLLLFRLATAPTGNPISGASIKHRFISDTTYNRYSITNLIPEIEQVNLGFALMPLVDSYLTAEQANRVSDFTLDLYAEMEQDADFRELGSAMGWAYSELLGQPFNVGHYYLYVPQQQTTDPVPVLIFLHGSAGNFKAYSWMWSRWAEAQGVVLIAPSYGFGSWDTEGAETVLRILEDAKQVANIDDGQIFLAGLSNGGLGVSQLANEHADLFRGIIFLSPVMRTSLVDSEDFQEKWVNRPILVISGETDKRIPLDYVERRVENMRAGSVNVKSIYYPNEDHFLVFSQPDSIMQDVTTWIDEITKE